MALRPASADWRTWPWLSKPGIDVRTTADPNNMLLCPTKKNDQILMRGQVTTSGAGASVTVFFPSVLPSPPFVFFWPSVSSSFAAQPFYQSAWVYGEISQVVVFNDRAVFSNDQGARFFQFIVASRGIP